MTTSEVAELCRTSAETVRYWRHVGKGPRSIKVGRKVLYATEDVEAWLAQLTRDAGTSDRESTKSEKPDRATKSELMEVARIYRGCPGAPLKAVETRLGYSRRTAARRVAAAKASGLLPESDFAEIQFDAPAGQDSTAWLARLTEELARHEKCIDDVVGISSSWLSDTDAKVWCIQVA